MGSPRLMVIAFLSLALVATVVGQAKVLLTVNTTFGGTLCPGDAVFTCIGTGLSTLIWSMDGVDIISFDPDFEPQPGPDFFSPSFTVEVLDVEQDTDNPNFGNFSSILIADLRALSENMTRIVTCGDLGTMNISEIQTFTVQSPPPQPVYTCNITTEASAALTLVLNWVPPTITTAAIEEYCVRASGGACPERCVSPDTPYICEGLTAEQVHNFTVTAVNCGSQEGPADSFSITPRVPEAPALCSSVPVYLHPSGELDRVEVTWDPAAGLQELKAGISQNVTSYFVTYTGAEDVPLLVDEACTPTGQCNYTVTDLGEPGPYTVEVSAENRVARSAAKTCLPREIGFENNIVAVSLTSAANGDHILTCEFLSSILDSAACNVCYGTQSPCVITDCETQEDTGRATNVTFPAENTCFIINATIDGVRTMIEGSTEPIRVLPPWQVALIVIGAVSWTLGAVLVILSVIILVIIICRYKKQFKSKKTFIIIIIIAICTSIVLLLLSLSLWVAFGVVAAGEVTLQNTLCAIAFAFSILQLIASIICIILSAWRLKKNGENVRKKPVRSGREDTTDNKNGNNIELPKLQEHEDIAHVDLPEGVSMKNPNVQYDAVAGLDRQKQDLKNLLQPGVRQQLKGVLLYGFRGTGKATLVEAVATESNSIVFTVSCSDIAYKWGEHTTRNIDIVFQKARNCQSPVIFLKEVERLSFTRSASEREGPRRIITEFLSNNIEVGEGIIIVGTTHYPWLLDERVRQLFEKTIYIPTPDADARIKVITNSLKRSDTITDGQMNELVRKTAGFTGYYIKSYVEEGMDTAAMRCDKGDQPVVVTYKDIKKAIQPLRKTSCKPKYIPKYDKFTKMYGKSI